jgi:hypothetical protein
MVAGFYSGECNVFIYLLSTARIQHLRYGPERSRILVNPLIKICTAFFFEVAPDRRAESTSSTKGGVIRIFQLTEAPFRLNLLFI